MSWRQLPNTGIPADTTEAILAFLIGENIFQFVQPGYSRILIGAEQTCRQQGYRLLFHSVAKKKTIRNSGCRQAAKVSKDVSSLEACARNRWSGSWTGVCRWY